MHLSIMKSRDLIDELRKISQQIQDIFIMELTSENILELESIIKVHFKIESLKITYFLSVPIDFKIEDDLYCFLPIPTIEN